MKDRMSELELTLKELTKRKKKNGKPKHVRELLVRG
jgi:hypothetical protein